jgi:hypothetical protein
MEHPLLRDVCGSTEVAMLHWNYKLAMVASVALVVSSAVGSFWPLGFFW